MKTEDIQKVIAEMAVSANKGPRFASIKYTSKESGEIAVHSLTLGLNVENLYKKSLRILNGKLPYLQGVSQIAATELIASIKESLSKGIGNNSDYTLKDTMIPVFRGLKVHAQTHELYVCGFSRGKTIIQEGNYKIVKSSDKTIEKNKLRKLLPIGHLRTFSLKPEAFETLKVNGKVLEIA
jgi:hypothetical protein